MLGSIASGTIVNRYKNNHFQVMVATLLSCTSTVTFSLVYYFRILLALFILNAAYGFLICVQLVQLYEIAYQHLYPTKTCFIAVLLRLVNSYGSLIITQICRCLLKKFDGSTVFITISILYNYRILSFFVSIFVNPSYKRLEVSSLA